MSNLILWIEISKKALAHNIRFLKKGLKKVLIAPCVKANAYGHGLVESAAILEKNGADWLCVNSLDEAEKIRAAGIRSPLYIMGYVMKEAFAELVSLSDVRLVVYNNETLEALSDAAKKMQKRISIHVKVETGNNRQGILEKDVIRFIQYAGSLPGITIEGLATHFANIEDVHINKSGELPAYAQLQLNNFKKIVQRTAAAGISIPIVHCGNSAATLLFSQTHFSMVRPGIATYGLWPSEETRKIVAKKHAKNLQPVLSWYSRIAQIKKIPKGSPIGYGCSYKTLRDSRIAIIPVGYYDGYDRGLSNRSNVLIHGQRAPLRGRVCMNIIMVDVTKIPSARLEDTVTLLGKNGNEEISADELARLADTINYEITTRINESIPRIITN